RRLVEIDQTAAFRSNYHFLHGGIRAAQESPWFGKRQNGQGIEAAGGTDGGTLEGVERDVDLRSGSGADALAAEQNVAVVLLAFADHHLSVDGNRSQGLAHSFGSGTVGRSNIAAPHQPGRGEGGSFGDAHRLECQVSIHSVGSLPSQLSVHIYPTFH